MATRSYRLAMTWDSQRIALSGTYSTSMEIGIPPLRQAQGSGFQKQLRFGIQRKAYLLFLLLEFEFLAAARWARAKSTTRCISDAGAGLPVQISNWRAPC
jgi:hypothetical protein